MAFLNYDIQARDPVMRAIEIEDPMDMTSVRLSTEGRAHGTNSFGYVEHVTEELKVATVKKL